LGQSGRQRSVAPRPLEGSNPSPSGWSITLIAHQFPEQQQQQQQHSSNSSSDSSNTSDNSNIAEALISQHNSNKSVPAVYVCHYARYLWVFGAFNQYFRNANGNGNKSKLTKCREESEKSEKRTVLKQQYESYATRTE